VERQPSIYISPYLASSVLLSNVGGLFFFFFPGVRFYIRLYLYLSISIDLSQMLIIIVQACRVYSLPLSKLASLTRHHQTTATPQRMDVSTTKNPLPSTREFVDNLITELAGFNSASYSADVDELDQPRTQTAPPEKQTRNPLSGLSAPQLARVKPLMLALHCLFPNDLLPALDILDRGLVQRLVCSDQVDAMSASDQDQAISTDSPSECVNPAPVNGQLLPREDFFLVASASIAPPHGAAPSAFATQEPEKGYEVRLHAWNCTCPTFALSAFRDLASRLDHSTEHHSPAAMLRDRDDTAVYPFGGTLTCDRDRGSPPVCKHALACVLFARCPGLFGADGDGKRVVSMEELAGWCAGWGG
jgi:hypothetical protein